jgi:hypothetical protein
MTELAAARDWLTVFRLQYRPHLIDGRLAETGLTMEPW